MDALEWRRRRHLSGRSLRQATPGLSGSSITMNLLDQIAEARIQEAIERGELRGLPGEGKPLRLDDDLAIPEELRAAYRILKNAGFLPPELQLRKEIREAEQLLHQLPEGERSRARVRLELLQLRLAANRRQPINLLLEDHYRQRLLERLDHTDRHST